MKQSLSRARASSSYVLLGALTMATGFVSTFNTYANSTATITATTTTTTTITTTSETTTNTTPTDCSLIDEQTKIPNAAKSQQAVLRAIGKQFQANEVITGHFEQRKFITVLPQPLLSKGYFQLDPEFQLEWVITKPLPSRMIFDDDGIRQSQNGQQIWEISNDRPGVAIISELIRAALSFDWPIIETHFVIDVCNLQQPKTEQWKLSLTPKDNELQQAVRKINLSGEKHLETLILFEANNDRTEIIFEMP